MSIHPRDVARAVLLASLLGGAPAADAWGPDGHRITGEIAWRNLAPRTKQAVRALLPEGRFDTLADAAAWADTFAREHRREYRWLEPLHYMNADPRADHVRAGRDCGCVVGAVEIEADRLRDPGASRDAKIEALRLVAHFVGDVHQPLHVAHRDGRGGTTIDVRFDGEPTTLHKLWDSGLIERRLRELGRGRGPRWRRWAQSLADSVDASDRARWTAARDPRAWADESLALARSGVFAVRDGASLGDAYEREALPIVEQRLVQSGLRLAALLYAIFDRAAPLH